MYWPSLLLGCFSLFIATVPALALFGPAQSVLDDKVAVPGQNPLFYCQNNGNYSLEIEKVDLTPNPPKPGQTLLIQAQGTFSEDVEEGAYIHLSVKYGLITLIRQTADLCEQMKQVDEECPLSGDKVISKEVQIPKEVPPGKYTVLADVYTVDNEQITCLEATVHF